MILEDGKFMKMILQMFLLDYTFVLHSSSTATQYGCLQQVDDYVRGCTHMTIGND